MAITRTQIAKQLLANGGRIGFRGGDAARSDAASGRNAGRASPGGGVERGGGRDPTAQFKNFKTKIDLSNEAEKALKDQRKEARYQITPSTRPRNRVISGLLSSFVPFGGLLFNRAIDRQAMGFNTPTITDDDDDNIPTGGGDGENFRETMIAQQFTPFHNLLY